jgi:hypothetical protein
MADPTAPDPLTALHEAPRGSAIEVHVPAQVTVAVDGAGHPGTPEFRQCVRDLWRAAYAVQKLAAERGLPGSDYAMPPTEVDFATRDRNGSWRMFVVQPELVTDELLASALAGLAADAKPVENEVRRVVRAPEHAVQSTHVGTSEVLPQTLAVIDAYAAAHGLVLGAGQHEIFVDDPIRVGFDVARDVVRVAVVRT